MASTNLEMSINTLKEYIIRMMDKCEKAIDLSIKSMLTKDRADIVQIVRK